MKRILIVLLISIPCILILGACASATPAPTVEVVVPVIIDTPTPEVGCTAVTTAPTPTPGSALTYPPARVIDFSIGPSDAPVTIIEYCDFQSVGCRNMAVILDELMKNRDDVRVVFRPLPLIGILDKSDKAIIAALAADEQGRFWDMYNLLFAKFDEWVSLKPEAFNAWVIESAAKAGFDRDKLTAAIQADKTETRMASMHDAAKQLSIMAVPLILINGDPLYVWDYQSVSSTVGLIALGKKQFSECPPFNIDPSKQYTAIIETERGNIEIQLFPDKAPLAVNSFVFLAQQGWFDGVAFHRVIPGFIAQTGDPSGTGKGNPGYFFSIEPNDLKFDKPGRVGMANSGPNTNGSQFFITFSPASHLDGSYTIFGQVINGLDVAEMLTPRDPDQSVVFSQGDKIIHVTIEEK